MSGIAQIYDAELNPSKEQIADTFGGLSAILGSYRLVDRDDAVGIEALLGEDHDGRLVQLLLSYRSAEFDPQHTLTDLEHSVLGKRVVSNALGDPVAVREIIRTIITGDDGAAYSNGTIPYLNIRGSGSYYVKDSACGEVEIDEASRQSVIGTVEINGLVRSFGLRIPRILAAKKDSGVDHGAARMYLEGTTAAEPEQPLRVAELYWRDMQP